MAVTPWNNKKTTLTQQEESNLSKSMGDIPGFDLLSRYVFLISFDLTIITQYVLTLLSLEQLARSLPLIIGAISSRDQMTPIEASVLFLSIFQETKMTNTMTRKEETITCRCT